MTEPPAPAARRTRRRATHSMESVVSEAVALLDEAGESALTFRALAARLGGGVASIYWYVSNKEELLDKATDHVLRGVVEKARDLRHADDPVDDIRAIAQTLFDAVVDRPWLGTYLMRDTDAQTSGMQLYELIGQQILRLGLTPWESFGAVSAVTGFVIGTATDLGQSPPPELLAGETDRTEFIHDAADRWRALDPAEYPFIHYIVDEFAEHDDTEQFRAGLDLLLAGLRLQAEKSRDRAARATPEDRRPARE
ncbi:MAG: TetR/AcrR family transcriptional regulator C-terminal domain-containing protein [Gordonia sp. (in: high G+C Gram-positive bacteria)]|uniref:TetR/AcrR family transcriptional regulator n=1 Tax=Gordonia sp. (in: high G+C Gram-positive bacteria) TaxID=84139 RepID=UPI0039E44456